MQTQTQTEANFAVPAQLHRLCSQAFFCMCGGVDTHL